MRGRLLVLVAVLGLAAGCLGGDDDPGTPTSEPSEGTDDPVRVWETVERSGTVTGAGIAGTGVSQADGNSVSWQAPSNSTILYLNITAEQAANDTGPAGQLSVEYGPNCETGDTVSCDYNTTTENGQALEVVEAPAGGTWEAFFFAENNAGEIDWTLTARMDAVR